MRTVAIAAAVNDDAVLDACLRASPDLDGGVPLRTYRGYESAAGAYNAALAAGTEDVLVLAHQDVYLPAGAIARLHRQLDRLDADHPEWAIAGLIGLSPAGDLLGVVWSSGLGKVVGGEASLPAQAIALDEMVIVVRRDAGLRFDEGLPGWHLYAADIVQIARAAGRSTWVIDLPAVHHSRAVVELGGGYRAAWNYMRRKWRAQLPIPNLVCTITRSPLTRWKRDLRYRLRFRRARDRPAAPSEEPAAIARRLGWE